MEDLFLETFIEMASEGGGDSFEGNYIFTYEQQMLYDTYYLMPCETLLIEIRAMDLNIVRLYKANTFNEYDAVIASYEDQQRIAQLAYVDKQKAGAC